MRYFLELAYNGTPFHGWQSQPNALSVQAILESALSKILKNKIDVTGAGRTDAGVHARCMYAHFDSEEEIRDISKFILSLNSLCGKYISINRLIKVKSDAHARFDAIERTYKYFVTYKKSPFFNDLCWFTPNHLDMEMMNEAARSLLETKDFTSFAKLHSDAKTNICEVRKARWMWVSDDIEAKNFIGDLQGGIVFTISADRFLRNMVRAIVGTLVDVGRHKLSIEDFKSIILKKNRCSAGTSMPAHALFLWDIRYNSEQIL